MRYNDNVRNDDAEPAAPLSYTQPNEACRFTFISPESIQPALDHFDGLSTTSHSPPAAPHSHKRCAKRAYGFEPRG